MAGELNAYDILVNDWVVFTDETLPGGAAADGGAATAAEPRPTATADGPAESTDTRARRCCRRTPDRRREGGGS